MKPSSDYLPMFFGYLPISRCPIASGNRAAHSTAAACTPNPAPDNRQQIVNRFLEVINMPTRTPKTCPSAILGPGHAHGSDSASILPDFRQPFLSSHRFIASPLHILTVQPFNFSTPLLRIPFVFVCFASFVVQNPLIVFCCPNTGVFEEGNPIMRA